MVIVHLGERYDVCPVSHPKRQGVARKFVLARKPMTSVLFTLGRYDVLLTADRLVGNGNFYIRAQSLEGDLDAQVVEGGGDHVALGVLRYHSTSATADNAPVAVSRLRALVVSLYRQSSNGTSRRAIEARTSTSAT